MMDCGITKLIMTVSPFRSVGPFKMHEPPRREDAVHQIALWLQQCCRHQSCDAERTTKLPSRLLEITESCTPNEFTVKLVSAESYQTPYMCLSHRWGNAAIIKTTKATLAEFKRNISWQSLPKTFQDAMFMTLRLGLRYIWIDSLCICQDDAEDWACEGSKMDSIYRGGYVTLAFSQSREGYFMDDDNCWTKEWVEGDLKYVINCQEVRNHTNLTADTMPLLSRAWVLQERHLSTRVVFFGEQELLWECLEKNTCECQNTRVYIDSKSAQKAYLSGHDCSDHTSATYGKGDYLWHQIIEEYSTQHLTFPRDVFPAIQGIAKRLHRDCASLYWAGLWSSTLHVDMLWRTANPRATLRPNVWRAPSWSWASVVGSVRWLRDHTQREWRPITQVKDISTTPVREDPLGELKVGCICLTGPCATASLHYNTRSNTAWGRSETFIVHTDYEGLSEYLPCDIDYHIPSPETTSSTITKESEDNIDSEEEYYDYIAVPGFEDILLMWIAEEFGQCGRTTRCIALRGKDAKPRTYERFGLVTFTSRPSKNTSLGFASRTITIL
jgi:hypothetical protein